MPIRGAIGMKVVRIRILIGTTVVGIASALENKLTRQKVCGLAVAGRIRCFTGISRDAEMCPGFPPPKGALRIIPSNEGVEAETCNSWTSYLIIEEISTISNTLGAPCTLYVSGY